MTISRTTQPALLCSKIHQEPREATGPSTERPERSERARPLARRRSHEMIPWRSSSGWDPLGEFVSSNLI